MNFKNHNKLKSKCEVLFTFKFIGLRLVSTVYIKVKVTTEAKKEKIIKKSTDHFDISIKKNN